MNHEYVDVLIIGAGPAGLRCAEVLGNSGLSVLILEKNKVVGPKVCAGGVTGLVPGEDLPTDKGVRFYQHHVFVNGKESVISLKHPIAMIDRHTLGDFQLNRLKRLNVRIYTDNKVISVNHDYAVTKRGAKIYFRHLVGADGAISLVRRYLGLKNKFYIGMQYITPKTYAKCCWVVQPRVLRSGYGWIFPHKKFTSAGVYFNPKLVPHETAKEFLRSILQRHDLDHPEAKLETAPINCRYSGVKFKNIFLAGEAAGLVSAASGEGIAYALTSGEDIGRHIVNPAYNFKQTDRLLQYKQRQEMALQVLDSVPTVLQDIMFMIFVRLLAAQILRNYFEGVE
ncbi:MAG: NAD(P)/FAD-dependent oxidoreductase [Deltaproteobacteria bacterium]|nr:NAD(P)/FAD-dependent oxidoreductase [Deltaproteobacteria bacterium]